MAIGTYELVILLTIQPKAILTLEVKGAYADTSDAAVERLLAVLDAGGYII